MTLSEQEKLENDKKLTQLLREKSSNRTYAYIDKKLTLIFSLGDAEGSLQYKEGYSTNDMTSEMKELFLEHTMCEYCYGRKRDLTTRECNCPKCERKHLICKDCESN